MLTVALVLVRDPDVDLFFLLFLVLVDELDLPFLGLLPLFLRLVEGNRLPVLKVLDDFLEGGYLLLEGGNFVFLLVLWLILLLTFLVMLLSYPDVQFLFSIFLDLTLLLFLIFLLTVL